MIDFAVLCCYDCRTTGDSSSLSVVGFGNRVFTKVEESGSLMEGVQVLKSLTQEKLHASVKSEGLLPIPEDD